MLGQVRRLLASPELVARTITAVRRENGTAENAQNKEGGVIEALGALDQVWDELYPAEACILRLLIERRRSGRRHLRHTTCRPDSQPRSGVPNGLQY
jgi:hypothetical protein